MSYLNETRYHWFSLDSEADLSSTDLELSVDQTAWVTAEHTTAPLLANLPDPAAGFTRFWWKALFGPALTLQLTSPEQTVYGRLTAPDSEELRPTWVVRSEQPAEVFPCSWPVDYCTDDGGVPEPLNAMDGTKVQRYERMAVDYLWNWTAQQFGTCTIAVRPCRRNCWVPGRWPFHAAPYGGRVLEVGCGVCGDTCGCSFTHQITLDGPAGHVEQVLIDGAVLDPSAYTLQNERYLVRTDGGQWPTCQDLAADTTQPGTWEITYTIGSPVPVGGQIAAGVLARELAKAACNDTTCKLPQRIQSITRQGVAIIMDTFQDLEKGGTGIWLIDSWVSSVTKAPTRSRVYSPDVSHRAPIRRLP